MCRARSIPRVGHGREGTSRTARYVFLNRKREGSTVLIGIASTLETARYGGTRINPLTYPRFPNLVCRAPGWDFFFCPCFHHDQYVDGRALCRFSPRKCSTNFIPEYVDLRIESVYISVRTTFHMQHAVKTLTLGVVRRKRRAVVTPFSVLHRYIVSKFYVRDPKRLLLPTETVFLRCDV